MLLMAVGNALGRSKSFSPTCSSNLRSFQFPIFSVKSTEAQTVLLTCSRPRSRTERVHKFGRVNYSTVQAYSVAAVLPPPSLCSLPTYTASAATNIMKQSKDPFEAAFEEQEESPPDSPVEPNDTEAQIPASSSAQNEKDTAGKELITHQGMASTSAAPTGSARNMRVLNNKNKEDDEEEEEENMDMELKVPSSSDPDKMAQMQAILSQFTEGQMSRYESFRRSGFQKSTMKRLLASITGSQKISVPMTIAVSGIAKMFVGELVETAKGVMTERNDSGPIRPCHIREAYRRLKMEGKVPRRSVSRLFR